MHYRFANFFSTNCRRQRFHPLAYRLCVVGYVEKTGKTQWNRPEVSAGNAKLEEMLKTKKLFEAGVRSGGLKQI